MIIRRMNLNKPEATQVTEADHLAHPDFRVDEVPALRSRGFGFETTPNQTVTTSQRPPSWRSFRPDPPELDPTHPAFERVHRDSPMFTSEAKLDVALDAARSAFDRITGTPAETAVAAGVKEAELDIWKKITVQRGRVHSWFLTRLDPAPRSIPGPWMDACRTVVSHLLQQPAALQIPPAPLDTNAGFPAFTGGLPAKLLSAALAVEETWQAVDDNSVWFCDRVGLPPSLAQAFGINSRQGPFSKRAPYYVMTAAGEWQPSIMASGAWPRTRQVFMGSFGCNVALEPLLARLQGGRRVTPGFWHSKGLDEPLVQHAWRSGLHIIEADISGYDQSVSPSLQAALAECITAADPSLAQQAALYLYAERRAVVTPAWDGGMGWTAVMTRGATHSGQRLTAEVGTVICAATTIYALALLQHATPQAIWDDILTRRIILLVQGDDILLGTPKAIDPDQWSEAWATVGLNCHSLRGFRFLMKHRLATGNLPVAGRIVQQTISNEHEPHGIDWDPILVLGMEARWGSGPPAEYADLARSVIRTTEFSERTGVVDGPTAREWLTNPANQERVRRKLVRLASDPWLKRLRNESQYSDSARIQFERLVEAGLLPETDDDTTLRSVFQLLLARLKGKSRPAKRQIASDLWTVIQAGGPPTAQLEATQRIVYTT